MIFSPPFLPLRLDDIEIDALTSVDTVQKKGFTSNWSLQREMERDDDGVKWAVKRVRGVSKIREGKCHHGIDVSRIHYHNDGNDYRRERRTHQDGTDFLLNRHDALRDHSTH